MSDIHSRDQRAVAEWYRQNGGHASLRNAVDRTADELRELTDALFRGDPDAIRDEAADVGLCLLMVAEIAGFDLMTAIRRKQLINDGRLWRVDEAGCLHHIKPSDAERD
jgi:NTP pyrophosphatase (non-canonical NTP hydrolase)